MTERVSPLEIVLSPRVQKLLDHFAEVLGLRVTFYDAEHRVLCRGLRMRNCSFCRKIQEQFGLLERCTAMDARMQNEVRRSRKELCYTCHAGLKEVLAPIYIGGRLGGYIMLGQFRDTDVFPVGLSSDLQPDFFQLPCYAPDQLQGILGLLQMLMDYISARELASLKVGELRSDILKYLKLHRGEKICLKQVADFLGRSVSHVSHELRDKYNTTFTDLLLEQKIAWAEKTMTEHPDMSLRVVAAVSGFSESCYFSKVYKKIRGITPAAFRKKVNSEQWKTVNSEQR